MTQPLLTIGELSERTGVRPSALRYYEELGMIAPPLRVSGRRRYAPWAVQLVGMILLLRDIGFTLAETKVLTASRSPSDDLWRDLTRHKLAELEERINRASAAQVALQHALRCKHQDLLDCPNFRAVLAARLEHHRAEADAL